MTPTTPTYPPTLLDEEKLRRALARLPRFSRTRYFITVDSTNARAVEELHLDDTLGTSFVTEAQDEGRGRAGRTWWSPAGAGLYCTTIIPVELGSRALPAVGFWAALATASAIRNVTSLEVGLKWPNDLLLDGSKCCGILIEGRSLGDVNRVAVGVGLNVNRPALEQPVESAWLSDGAGAAIDRTALLVALLSEYERSLDDLVAAPEVVIQRWDRASKLRGTRVSVSDAGGSLLCEGTVRAIGADGALLLDTDAGPRTVRLGDVAAV